MTLYDSTRIVDEKIKVMYNKLYTLLNNYNLNISRDNTFSELIEKVDTIPGVQYYYNNNIKPSSSVIFNSSDSLLRKEIKIYYKIQYLSDYLKYALLVKGIPRKYIKSCETLDELIDLVGLINKIKAPTLNIDINQTDYYYNSYINLDYSLVDENNNEIDNGYIIVLEDNIEITRIPAGLPLKFLPSDIGTFNYTFYYEGTDEILPTEKQNYTFNILPPSLNLFVSGKNIGESQYKNEQHIGYDEDIFELTINTTNPYINAPLVNIPVTVIVPQKNNVVKHYYGQTDDNGLCYIDIKSDNIGSSDIIIKTTNNARRISNATVEYDIIIYNNPIKIDDYVFAISQEQRDMEIFFYDGNGEITNNYLTSEYKIIQKYLNANYRTYDLNNKENPFVINELHEDINTYQYEYQLYKNNKLICTTTNSVRIKRDISIELIPVNKFLEENTKNTQFYIYVTNYLGNPIPNVSLKLIDTYSGIHSQIYTTNNKGIITDTINIEEILTNPCNGFLLQAIIPEQESNDVCQIQYDDYSNIVYYRIHNDYELDTYIDIKTVNTYSLEEPSFDIILTIYDEEGERVLRPLSYLSLGNETIIETLSNSFLLSSSTNNSNTNNIIDGNFSHVNIYDYEDMIGDNLILIAEYNGENNHYNKTIATKNITFIKSNVIISTTLPVFTVYEETIIDITLTIQNVDSKYITGDVSIIIDGESYETEKNNNIYTASITPLNAKETQISIDYNGGKYTNANIINYPLNIEKTNKYKFDCDIDNDEINIFESMIFSPILDKDTVCQQDFNGTITYEFSNGETITQRIGSLIYTPSNTGEQSVIITYNGDNNHYSKSITKTFIVNKIYPTLLLNTRDKEPIYRGDIDYNNVSLKNVQETISNLIAKYQKKGYAIIKKEKSKYNFVKGDTKYLIEIMQLGNGLLYCNISES